MFRNAASPQEGATRMYFWHDMIPLGVCWKNIKITTQIVVGDSAVAKRQ